MWPWTRSWPARRREGDWGACMRSIVVRRETREGYVLPQDITFEDSSRTERHMAALSPCSLGSGHSEPLAR